jgi:hypothetical protein
LGAAASTWTAGACAVAVGPAEPDRIDPAALSAMIAGMMMVRLMRMISSMTTTEASSLVLASSNRPGRILSQAELCQFRAITLLA